MQRFHQLLFTISLLALSWLIMMALHEAGHVLGALLTGGSVDRVVLHPLAISRTDVSPNPHPAIVVWLGPIIGSLLPILLMAAFPIRLTMLRKIAQFFAGFCLIANGAYIALGSFSRVGDCGEMLRTGSPLWSLIAFGIVTSGLGIILWHKLGSIREFIDRPALVPPKLAMISASLLIVVVIIELALFRQ